MTKWKILIVDDIYTNRFLIKELLKPSGCQYWEAENGKEALKLLETEEVDMVFMDLEMPVMNGFETTRCIKEKFPYAQKKLPVIAITAFDPAIFTEELKNTGFDDIITKPYSSDKLKSAVEFFCHE